MSVNAGMRNVPDTPANRQCNAVESAMTLCLHTIKICANRNIFTPEYMDIVSMATSLAIDIYVNANTANNIRVTNTKSCNERLELEWTALNLCNSLISVIEICYRLFHLRMKKKEYWASLAHNAKNLINRWYLSDKDRYAKYMKDVS